MELETLKSLLTEGKKIKLALYSLNEPTQKNIYSTILEILNFYNKEQFFTAIYTVVFETTMNAVKANAKRAYFKSIDLNFHDDFEYRKGTIKFKNLLVDNQLENYCKLAKEQGLYIEIDISHSKEGIKIEVLNNCELLIEEEKRIRKKFSLAKKYFSIVDFYQDNSDSTEGEGLGLVVSCLMLKQDGIPISDFRIGSKKGITKARIEIPFTPSYISERERYIIENERSNF